MQGIWNYFLQLRIHISLSHLSEKKNKPESDIISWTLSTLFGSSVDNLVGYIAIKQYLISIRFELRREYNTLWVEDGAGCVLGFFFNVQATEWWNIIPYQYHNTSLCLQKTFLVDIYWNPSHWAQGIVIKG